MKFARLVLSLVAAAVIVIVVTALKSAVSLGAQPVSAALSDLWTYLEMIIYGLGIWIVTEIGVVSSAKRRRQARIRSEQEGDREHSR